MSTKSQGPKVLETPGNVQSPPEDEGSGEDGAEVERIDPGDGGSGGETALQFEDGAREPSPDLEPMEFQSGDWIYRFGERCTITKPDGEDENGEPQYTEEPIAREVYPLQLYQHVDENEFGIRFAYRDVSGELHFGTVSAGATTSKSAARTEAARQADQGVQIETRKGSLLVRGLGKWRDHADNPDVVYLTSEPGWHDNCGVYVNGRSAVWGDPEADWFVDSTESMKRRGARSGSASEWREQVEQLVTTNGLRLAFGAALAGPLVGYTGGESFMLHLFGTTSRGKTTAAESACSVWGNRSTHFNDWDATEKAITGLAKMADDSCLILDDIGKFGGSAAALGRTAYAIASGEDRDRCTKTGEIQESESWNLVGISTGEVSMANRIGDYLKGGQSTRMVDLHIENGELTRNAEHAEELQRSFTERGASAGVYGWAGDRWVDYLVHETAPKDVVDSRRVWRDKLDAFGTGVPQEGRILNHLALIATAFEHGRYAGLLTWSDETIREVIFWAAERVMEAREGERTPIERACTLLEKLVRTEPQRFPKPSRCEQAPTPIYGYERSAPGDESGRTIWTSKAMLEKAGIFEKAGVSARRFFQWCEDEDYCGESRQKSIKGNRYRWRVFDGL